MTLSGGSSICKGCGAPLPLPDPRQPVRCIYCGRVAGPRPAAQPKSGSEAPARGTPTSSINRAVVTLLFVVMSGLVAWIRVRAALRTSRPAPTVASRAESPPEATDPVPSDGFALVDRPLLYDADDDGTEDIIGIFASTRSADERWLGARSGTNGRELWKASAGFTAAALDPSRTIAALASDTLVVADDGGRLTAIAPQNGTTIWTRELERPARDICAGSDFVVVFSNGNERSFFALTTGTPMPPDPHRTCHTTYTSRADASNFTVVEGAALAGDPAVVAAKMNVARALVPLSGPARVLLGTERTDGSPPAVAVVAKGKLLWRAAVGAFDPAESSLLSPPQAAVRKDRIVVPYLAGPGEPTLRMACFAVDTGRRFWDVALAGEAPSAPQNGADVLASRDGQVLYRSPAGRLHVLALADGTERFSLGGP